MEEQILEVPEVGEVHCFRDADGREASASRLGAWAFYADSGDWVPLHMMFSVGIDRGLRAVSFLALKTHRALLSSAAA